MKKCLTVLLAVSLIFLPSLPSKAVGVREIPEHVLLIVWDGTGRDAIKLLMEKNDLPNLKSLTEEGALVAIDIRRVTRTVPGITEIVTGYPPEVTGIHDSKTKAPIPKGLTLFERLKKEFGPNGIVTFAVVGSKGSTHDINRSGGLFYNALDSIDKMVSPLKTQDEIGAETLSAIETYHNQRFFFFVHFHEPDEAGHRHGGGSKEYYEGILDADRWLGKIMEKLKSVGIIDKTLIYITADHGYNMGMTDHPDAPFIFLATNDTTVMRRGERTDIAPTILARFGIPVETLQPALEGSPLSEFEKTKPYW
ncbi:MAG: alkaline phosphatase family protein [Candidatus Omnitrophica bacterium]|nr:alkaline phosphatase family protein [Candidatus Omnitrophota bacterium]